MRRFVGARRTEVSEGWRRNDRRLVMSVCRTLTLFLFTGIACTGAIGEDEAPGDETNPPGTPGDPANPAGSAGAGGGELPGVPGVPLPPNMPPSAETKAACTSVSPGPSPLRRLTRAEYANTIRDLLGVTESPSNAFAP